MKPNTQLTAIQMVDLVGQYQHISTEINEGIQQILQAGAYIGGKVVTQFAENLANYLNVKHAIPCANGTDALQIALMALDLQPNDEIITSSFTFVATAEVIALLQLKPVFVDINPQTFNIDASKIEEKINSRTRCIIPVHLYGQSADMQPIIEIAKKHNLYVIEDNAQAIGANYTFKNGTTAKTGTIGHIGCTSFYPSKNLGAYGDAGALFTNDTELAQKITTIANHGQQIKYTSNIIGVNSRLDAIQAHILNTKLKHLNKYIAARQSAAHYYDTHLKQIPQLTIPKRAENSSHVFHQYTLIYNGNRDNLQQQLQQHGIPTMVYYPIPIHQQVAYQYFHDGTSLLHTEDLAKQVISLPMHTELSVEQLAYITQTLIKLV